MADKMAHGARLSEHAQNIKEEVYDTAKDVGNSLAEVAGQYAKQAKEYAQDGYEYAAIKTKKAKKTAEHYIAKNPWQAVGIALGVGVFCGLMLRRGSRN